MEYGTALKNPGPGRARAFDSVMRHVRPSQLHMTPRIGPDDAGVQDAREFACYIPWSFIHCIPPQPMQR